MTFLWELKVDVISWFWWVVWITNHQLPGIVFLGAMTSVWCWDVLSLIAIVVSASMAGCVEQVVRCLIKLSNSWPTYRQPPVWGVGPSINQPSLANFGTKSLANEWSLSWAPSHPGPFRTCKLSQAWGRSKVLFRFGFENQWRNYVRRCRLWKVLPQNMWVRQTAWMSHWIFGMWRFQRIPVKLFGCPHIKTLKCRSTRCFQKRRF